MKFYERNWFLLIVSFVLSFIMSTNQKPLEFTEKSLTYFGIELLILMILTFVTLKLFSFIFSKIENKLKLES